MTDKEAEQIIKAATNIIVDAILGMIQIDSHTWSNRPCQTCLTITGIIGKSFGCYKYQEDLRKRKAESEETK